MTETEYNMFRMLTDKIAVLSAKIDELSKSITNTEKTRQTQGKRGLNMKQACKAYGHTYKTMIDRINAGIYYAYKEGGEWVVELPEERHERINNTNNQNSNLWNL